MDNFTKKCFVTGEILSLRMGDRLRFTAYISVKKQLCCLEKSANLYDNFNGIAAVQCIGC